MHQVAAAHSRPTTCPMLALSNIAQAYTNLCPASSLKAGQQATQPLVASNITPFLTVVCDTVWTRQICHLLKWAERPQTGGVHLGDEQACFMALPTISSTCLCWCSTPANIQHEEHLYTDSDTTVLPNKWRCVHTIMDLKQLASCTAFLCNTDLCSRHHSSTTICADTAKHDVCPATISLQACSCDS